MRIRSSVFSMSLVIVVSLAADTAASVHARINATRADLMAAALRASA